jgi:hypothetical protein
MPKFLFFCFAVATAILSPVFAIPADTSFKGCFIVENTENREVKIFYDTTALPANYKVLSMSHNRPEDIRKDPKTPQWAKDLSDDFFIMAAVKRTPKFGIPIPTDSANPHNGITISKTAKTSFEGNLFNLKMSVDSMNNQLIYAKFYRSENPKDTSFDMRIKNEWMPITCNQGYENFFINNLLNSLLKTWVFLAFLSPLLFGMKLKLFGGIIKNNIKLVKQIPWLIYHLLCTLILYLCFRIIFDLLHPETTSLLIGKIIAYSAPLIISFTLSFFIRTIITPIIMSISIGIITWHQLGIKNALIIAVLTLLAAVIGALLNEGLKKIVKQIKNFKKEGVKK